jgi:hypothetical protein
VPIIGRIVTHQHEPARLDRWEPMKGGLIWTIVGILLIVALVIWIARAV